MVVYDMLGNGYPVRSRTAAEPSPNTGRESTRHTSRRGTRSNVYCVKPTYVAVMNDPPPIQPQHAYPVTPYLTRA